VNSAETPESIVIEPLTIGEFDWFIAYLTEHLAENGSEEVGYFQPVSREVPTLPLAKAEAFRSGLGTAVPEVGWRRAWVARQRSAFVGHIDLRARPEPFTSHRCLLGMGVHREYRRRGLAGRLLAMATAWAVETSGLDWIDLEVLSTNLPAVRFYEKAGFELVGDVADLFRIDGLTLGSRTMTKRLRGAWAG
jgi:ribosomal protein S18 acetylase RimI-like enzyme